MKYALKILQKRKEDINDGLRFYKRKIKNSNSKIYKEVYKKEIQTLIANLCSIDKAIIILKREGEENR